MARAAALTGNASSVHSFGRAGAGGDRDRAGAGGGAGRRASRRRSCSRRVGPRPTIWRWPAAAVQRFLVSAIEHDSVLTAAPLRRAHSGRPPMALSISPRSSGCWVATRGRRWSRVMLANNETGVIQPMAEVVAIAHRAGALVHCDAVQAAGKLAAGFRHTRRRSRCRCRPTSSAGRRALARSSSRITVPLTAQLRGGGQERGRRAGTENVAAIAGFGVAADEARRDLAGHARHRRRCATRLEQRGRCRRARRPGSSPPPRRDCRTPAASRCRA